MEQSMRSRITSISVLCGMPCSGAIVVSSLLSMRRHDGKNEKTECIIVICNDIELPVFSDEGQNGSSHSVSSWQCAPHMQQCCGQAPSPSTGLASAPARSSKCVEGLESVEVTCCHIQGRCDI